MIAALRDLVASLLIDAVLALWRSPAAESCPCARCAARRTLG